MLPVTSVLDVYPRSTIDMEHIIVRFKGKRYRVQKGGPGGPGLNVYTNRGRGYYYLKTKVGEGIFADMLKSVNGLPLPPGYKQ